MQEVWKKHLQFRANFGIILSVPAGVVELADALDSKSCGSDTVSVRPRSPAPKKGTLMGAFFWCRTARRTILFDPARGGETARECLIGLIFSPTKLSSRMRRRDHRHCARIAFRKQHGCLFLVPYSVSNNSVRPRARYDILRKQITYPPPPPSFEQSLLSLG